MLSAAAASVQPAGESGPWFLQVLKVTLTNLNATATAAPLAVSIAMSLPVTVVSQTSTLSNVTTSNNTISGMITQSYQTLEPEGLTSITVALMAATPFTGAAPGFFQPTAVVLNGNPCSVSVTRMPFSATRQDLQGLKPRPGPTVTACPCALTCVLPGGPCMHRQLKP